MPLLSLIGRLGLDTTNFESNLKKSEATAAAFGNKFQRSIVSTVGRFFTLGYAINFVQDKIEKLNGEGEKSLVEDVDAQAIQAQYDAIEVLEHRLEMTQAVTKSEQQLADQIRKNALAGMTDEEKRLALMKEMETIRMKIEQTPKNQRLSRLRLATESERIRGELIGLDKAKKPDAADRFQRVSLPSRQLDPLARIGGLGGRADVRMSSYLERTAKATEETASNTGKNGVSFK